MLLAIIIMLCVNQISKTYLIWELLKDICPPPPPWPPAHAQCKRTFPGGVYQRLRSPRTTSKHVIVACLYIRKWHSSLFFITSCPLNLEWPSLLRHPSIRPAGTALHPSGHITKLTSQTLSRAGGFRSWEPICKAYLHVHSPLLPGLPGSDSVLPHQQCLGLTCLNPPSEKKK